MTGGCCAPFSPLSKRLLTTIHLPQPAWPQRGLTQDRCKGPLPLACPGSGYPGLEAWAGRLSTV